MLDRMRNIFIITVLLTTFALKASKMPLDTITNWQIYYGKILLVKGNASGHFEPSKVSVKVDSSRKLKIFYRYDAVKPEWRRIVIKSQAKIVYDEIQHLKDNHPALISLQDLKLDSNKVTADIYYSDNISKGKEILIGSIVISK
jgi:hypothetical protein